VGGSHLAFFVAHRGQALHTPVLYGVCFACHLGAEKNFLIFFNLLILALEEI
jgi:hypothetical protein